MTEILVAREEDHELIAIEPLEQVRGADFAAPGISVIVGGASAQEVTARQMSGGLRSGAKGTSEDEKQCDQGQFHSCKIGSKAEVPNIAYSMSIDIP